jgi:hypothetical protein
LQAGYRGVGEGGHGGSGCGRVALQGARLGKWVVGTRHEGLFEKRTEYAICDLLFEVYRSFDIAILAE